MKSYKAIIALLFTSFFLVNALAGVFDPRSVFGTDPSRDLDNSIKRATVLNKRVLLFFWNSKEKGTYPGYEMNHFAGLDETKKLLKNNFILVLLDQQHPKVKKYIPEWNIEKAQWVLIDFDGNAIKQAAVSGNPDVGLRTVRELIDIP